MTRSDRGFWICIAMSIYCGICGNVDQAAAFSAAAIAITSLGDA